MSEYLLEDIIRCLKRNKSVAETLVAEQSDSDTFSKGYRKGKEQEAAETLNEVLDLCEQYGVDIEKLTA
jgi:hypothetical protein